MPGINGREYQLATLDVTLVGPSSTFTFSTLKDVKYKTARPKEPVRNQKGDNIGWTSKDEDTSGASMRCLLSEWKTFKEWAATQWPGRKVSSMPFNAVLTYGEDPLDFLTDKWEGAMFNEEARASGSDQKEHEIELPLFILHVHMHGGEF